MTLLLWHKDLPKKPVPKIIRRWPDDDTDAPVQEEAKVSEMQIYPRTSNRAPCPPEVPEEYAEDYNEATLVLPVSPNAAAALGRRCLQHFIQTVGGIPKQRNLDQEITLYLKDPELPSDIAKQLDAVRNLGNIGAHAMKNEVTGEIVDVGPEEAVWTLDILEELFDWNFIRRERIRRMTDDLNNKLESVGRPSLKDASQ